MGIDAFGRGTYGGGGFNCNIALEKARSNDVSVALFACAWPYEKHNNAVSDDTINIEEPAETFLLREVEEETGRGRTRS